MCTLADKAVSKPVKRLYRNVLFTLPVLLQNLAHLLNTPCKIRERNFSAFLSSPVANAGGLTNDSF